MILSSFPNSSYRCHKGCAEKAPHSCGLPRELMNFFRQQLLNKTSPSASFDNIISSTEPYSARPGMRRGSTYDADTRESEEDFIIPELTKEPTKGVWGWGWLLTITRTGDLAALPFLSFPLSVSQIGRAHV